MKLHVLEMPPEAPKRQLPQEVHAELRDGDKIVAGVRFNPYWSGLSARGVGWFAHIRWGKFESSTCGLGDTKAEALAEAIKQEREYVALAAIGLPALESASASFAEGGAS